MKPADVDQPPLQGSGSTNQNDINLELAGPGQLDKLLPLIAAFHLSEEISLSTDIREKSVARLLGDSQPRRISITSPQKSVSDSGSRISAPVNQESDSNDNQNDHQTADPSVPSHSPTHSPTFTHHRGSPLKEFLYIHYDDS